MTVRVKVHICGVRDMAMNECYVIIFVSDIVVVVVINYYYYYYYCYYYFKQMLVLYAVSAVQSRPIACTDCWRNARRLVNTRGVL